MAVKSVAFRGLGSQKYENKFKNRTANGVKGRYVPGFQTAA